MPLAKALREKIRDQIPPKFCSGTSKQSGQRCKRRAAVGHDVCKIHGANSPQAKRKAAQRIALAEAATDFDLYEAREPWEVIRDCLHVADVLLRRAKVANNGQPYSPQDLDTLTTCISRAANLSKMNLDAGYDERRVRLKEAQAAQIQSIFVRVLTGLDLTPTQQAMVPALLQREIGAMMPKVIEAEAA